MEKKQIQLLFQIINIRYQTTCAFCKTGIIKPAPLQEIVRFRHHSAGRFRCASVNIALQPSSRYSAAHQFASQLSSRCLVADHLQRKLRSRNKKSGEVQPLKKDNGVVVRHSSTFSLSRTLPFTHSSTDFGSNDN